MFPSGNSDLDFLGDRPIEGLLLAEILAKDRLSAEVAFEYAIEIGAAIDQVHERGLFHGSLSPYAIAISPSGIQILKPNHPDVHAAPYRAPEQVRGGETDARSDIFAYGAILYELACGVRAFAGEGPELDHALLKKSPPVIPPGSPLREAMGGIITSCLAKERAGRRQRIRNAVIELKLNRRLFRQTLQASRPLVNAAPPLSLAPPRAAVIEFPQAVPTPLVIPPPASTPVPPVFTQATSTVDRFLLSPVEESPGTIYEPVSRRVSAERPSGDGILGSSSAGSRGWRFWLAAAGTLALFLVTAVGAVGYLRHRPAGLTLRFSVAPPDGATYLGNPAVSPDGRHLVFSAMGMEGTRMLWLRPFDAEDSAPIPGTEGASNPFWSPDSRSIGFFADKALKRASLATGESQVICPVDAETGGGTWSRDGTIVFAPSLRGGLYMVRANGGQPVRIVNLKEGSQDASFLWPQFLPDGRNFLFFVRTNREDSTGVYSGSLASPDYFLLFPSETNAVYSPLPDDRSQREGWLLYIRNRKMLRRGFDARRIATTGEPSVVAEGISPVQSQSLAPISVSNNDTMAYQALPAEPTRRLVWLDRSGSVVTTVRVSGEWGPPRISRNGTQAMAGKLDPEGKAADLWLIDLDGSVRQFTSTEAHEGAPVWSPDGDRVAFFMTSVEVAGFDLYVMPVTGARKPEPLLQNAFPKYPTDWSADGRFLFFNSATENSKIDLWALTLDARKSSGPVVETIHTEGYGALSPDGKWLAYQSDESGRNEIHVQPFKGLAGGTERQWRIDRAGGALPRWRGDGKELYYLNGSGELMAAVVHPRGGQFEFDPPQVLFQTPMIGKTWNLFDVTPDGQHFLCNLPLEGSATAPITVVTNWSADRK